MNRRLLAMLMAALLLSGCAPAVPAQRTASPVVIGLAAATPAPTVSASPELEHTDAQPIAETPACSPLCPELPPETLVAVRDHIPDILVELRYASENNFTGTQIYDFTEPQLRYGTVQKLLAAQRMLSAQGYGLKIYDAYRPSSAQYRLFETCPDSRYVADPYRGFSSHSRGNTVDVTLVTADGGTVEMPSAFDDFSALADRSYDDVSEAARAHALLLEAVMTECGFSPYQKEWWHFSDTDAYPVIEDNRFIASCEEFLSLRELPDTSAPRLMRIPAGDALAVVSYTGPFALVNYRATRGYVLASYLTREGPEDYETLCPELPPETLVAVRDHIPDILVELRYASENNFTGTQIYDFTEPQLRYGTVQKLLAAQRMLSAQGYGLKIYDAYRPSSAQYRLFETCPDSRYVADPYRGFSSHSRGNTVDVTLVAADGGTVEMPSSFDDFSALADRSYDDVSEAARAHALLLEAVMTECGFSPYQKEWWHFSDTDAYPVIEDNRFIASCEEFLSLRELPDTSAPRLMRIPAGDALAVVSYTGPFALVNYRGTRGYVLASYLTREGPEDYETLSIVHAEEAYSYERMCEELLALCAAWPGRISVSSIGRSELGRDIPVALLGDAAAQRHVLIQGAMHGRESITACLLMCLLESALQSDAAALAGVCFHVIPMSNPDGVAISQSGELTGTARKIYMREIAEGVTTLSETAYARQWKANALGIDLNRNFDAGWDTYDGPAEPSCARYRGDAPLCAAESRALAAYTRQYPFEATISYHCAGSLLYYEYGGNAAANARSASLAQAVAKATGYPMRPASDVDGAGYKDWALGVLGIPSLTIEVGYGSAPLPLDDLTTIYLRNRPVFARIAGWLQSSTHSGERP